MEAQLTAVGGARHGTNADTGTHGGVFRLRLDSRTRHRIRDRETREMLENWQPWFDILLLLGTCVILSPVLYYIDRRENDDD